MAGAPVAFHLPPPWSVASTRDPSRRTSGVLSDSSGGQGASASDSGYDHDRDEHDDDGDGDYGGGEEEDSDLELMAAAALAQGQERERGRSSGEESPPLPPPVFHSGTADSDNDDEPEQTPQQQLQRKLQPPPPPQQAPSGEAPAPPSALAPKAADAHAAAVAAAIAARSLGNSQRHLRRKSAMDIFSGEIALATRQLAQPPSSSPTNAGSASAAAAAASAASASSSSSASAARVTPFSFDTAMTRAASASVCGNSAFSPSSVPPSPMSLGPPGRSVSQSQPPTSPTASSPGSQGGSLYPAQKRRGSDFRQRLDFCQRLSGAGMLSAFSPSGSNKNKCVVLGCLAFAARQCYCLRHVWRLSVEELEPVNQRQYQVAKELVTTEKSYLDSLRVLWKSFVCRIHALAELEPAKPLLEPAEVLGIFHNIEPLFRLAENLYADLEEIMLEKVLTTQIGTTLLHYAPQFRIYQSYLENYDDAVRKLGHVRRDRPEFDFFCRLQEKCEGMSLESFLIMPVQRLPRYLLLLSELIKRSEPVGATASGPASPTASASATASATGTATASATVPESALADMVAAKDKISHIAASINHSLHHKEAQLKVAAIQARFERDSRYQDLVTPTRLLVREGPLKKRYGKGTRHLSSSTVYYFFLFNDLLVYADVSKSVMGRGGVTYRMRHCLPILDMVVEPTSSARGKNKDISVTTKAAGSTKSFDLSCADTADRDVWLAAFIDTIAKLKEENKLLKTNTYDGTDRSSNSSKLKALMGL